MGEFEKMKAAFGKGWRPWNTRSVLSHILLPEGFAVNPGIKEYRDGQHLRDALMRRPHQQDELLRFGPCAYDGSYSELKVEWKSIRLRVQAASDETDLVILVTPLENQKRPATLIVESAVLWNRPGHIEREGDVIVGCFSSGRVRVFGAGKAVIDPNVLCGTPYLALSLAAETGISTGKARTIAEIRELVEKNREKLAGESSRFGELSKVHDAIRTCIGWNTIYEPDRERPATTMSRVWNCEWGGRFDCCWDTYFASLLASVDSKELAYANAAAITDESDETGFTPNFSSGTGCRSRDRSQPPVGSMVMRELYRMYGDKWFLERVFDKLLRWNRWWPENRDTDGYLCWGSNPYEPVVGNFWEENRVNERAGGALESGLDNSPMYDDVPFDEKRHQLMLADVGLMSFYVTDCQALGDIAEVIGRKKEATELRSRGEKYLASLKTLWDENTGIFLNKRMDTGEFSPRLSPANFYPLMSKAATQAQAERMMKEHFHNPEEFWGEWMLPSISRNDPAYRDMDYWRGPIWAPMNFLVYLGLRNYDLPESRAALAEKSLALFLSEWETLGHIHENYHAENGKGCFGGNSDPFYHWGSLLGLISLIENGQFKISEL